MTSLPMFHNCKCQEVFGMSCSERAKKDKDEGTKTIVPKCTVCGKAAIRCVCPSTDLIK